MKEADTFLSRLIEMSWFSPLWREIRAYLAGKLKQSSLYHLDIEPMLENLLLLHLCGVEMRKVWNMTEDYRPELLLEPYITRHELSVVQTKALRVLLTNVEKSMNQLEENEDQVVGQLRSGHKESPQHQRIQLEKETPANSLLLFQFRKHLVQIYNQYLEITASSEKGSAAKSHAQSKHISQALLIAFATQDLVVSSVIPASFGVHMLTAADCVTVQDFSHSEENTSSYVNQMRLHPLDPSADVYDLQLLLRYHSKADIDSLARKFLGKYLPSPLRETILLYRCLYKASGDSSGVAQLNGDSTAGTNEPSVVCVNELLRQGALKGVHDIIDRCPRSELISRMVMVYLVRSENSHVNPIQVIEGQHPVGSFAVTPELTRLAKRTEHLVYAMYLMSGTVTPRSVSVSLLLLRIFAKDSPVSEKILRLYRRITGEVLPSEQLHREYSVGSVAMKTFDLLFERDTELYESFLQHSSSSRSSTVANSHSGSSDALPQSEEMPGAGSDPFVSADMVGDKKSLLKLHQARCAADTGGLARPLHPPNVGPEVVPTAASVSSSVESSFPALHLLKGWLECGFSGGWFNIHTTLFLWDVLMCFGWDANSGIEFLPKDGSRNGAQRVLPATVTTMLPKLCFVLLQLLRKPLLERKSTEDLSTLLRKEGFKLRTKVVAEAVRSHLMGPNDLHIIDRDVPGKYDAHKKKLRELQKLDIECKVRTDMGRLLVCDVLNASENNALHALAPNLSKDIVWSPEPPVELKPDSPLKALLEKSNQSEAKSHKQQDRQEEKLSRQSSSVTNGKKVEDLDLSGVSESKDCPEVKSTERQESSGKLRRAGSRRVSPRRTTTMLSSKQLEAKPSLDVIEREIDAAIGITSKPNLEDQTDDTTEKHSETHSTTGDLGEVDSEEKATAALKKLRGGAVNKSNLMAHVKDYKDSVLQPKNRPLGY